MNQRIFSFLLIFSSVFISGTWGQKTIEEEIEKIIKYDTEIDLATHPGFIVSLISPEIRHIQSFGKDSIMADQVFELGGITKVFTSYLCIQLIQDSIFKLDAPINSLLPPTYKNRYLDKFTIQDLLMHQVPFPRRPNDLSKKELNHKDPYAYYSKEDVLNYYKNFRVPIVSKLGRKQLYYSHVSFALLEIILEIKTKKSYPELLRDYVLDPFKMDQSFIQDASITLKGFDRSYQASSPWTFRSFAASEGLKSTLIDLIRFVDANIGIGETRFKHIQEALKIRKRSKINRNLHHSLAWYIMDSKKTERIYTHAGSTDGNRAYVHFCPTTKTGVIILSQSNIGTEELGLLLLRFINYNWKNVKRNGKEIK